MSEETIVPIAVFIAIVLTVFVVMYFKAKSRSGVQKTIRLALEKGNDLTPELLDRLAAPRQNQSSDLRRGIISLSIGIGFMLFGYILGEEDAIRPMLGIGMFPVIIGVAYLILWKTSDREQES